MRPSLIARPSRWRVVRRLLTFAVACLLLAFTVVLPLVLALQIMHPVRFPVGDVTPADFGLAYEDVALQTADGLSLRGWSLPSQNGAAVILIHAYNGNRTGVLRHAALLARHGYGVLAYDTRTQGESEGDLYAYGWDATRDVDAALAELTREARVDPRRIGLLGLSAGAAIALRAAAENEHIVAVVAEGAGCPTFQDWLIDPGAPGLIAAPTMWMMYQIIEAASGVPQPEPLHEGIVGIGPRPVLLIAAGEDRGFNQAYYAAAGESAVLWDRAEPGHIDAFDVHPEDYEARVIRFLDEALLVP